MPGIRRGRCGDGRPVAPSFQCSICTAAMHTHLHSQECSRWKSNSSHDTSTLLPAFFISFLARQHHCTPPHDATEDHGKTHLLCSPTSRSCRPACLETPLASPQQKTPAKPPVTAIRIRRFVNKANGPSSTPWLLLSQTTDEAH